MCKLKIKIGEGIIFVFVNYYFKKFSKFGLCTIGDTYILFKIFLVSNFY